MEEDKEFMKEAVKASREYLKKACHKETGLSAEYAHYDGRPYEVAHDRYGGRHDWFYSDAYRTILNIALDYSWFAADDWAKQEAKHILISFVRRWALEIGITHILWMEQFLISQLFIQ